MASSSAGPEAASAAACLPSPPSPRTLLWSLSQLWGQGQPAELAHHMPQLQYLDMGSVACHEWGCVAEAAHSMHRLARMRLEVRGAEHAAATAARAAAAAAGGAGAGAAEGIAAGAGPGAGSSSGGGAGVASQAGGAGSGPLGSGSGLPAWAANLVHACTVAQLDHKRACPLIIELHSGWGSGTAAGGSGDLASQLQALWRQRWAALDPTVGPLRVHTSTEAPEEGGEKEVGE